MIHKKSNYNSVIFTENLELFALIITGVMMTGPKRRHYGIQERTLNQVNHWQITKEQLGGFINQIKKILTKMWFSIFSIPSLPQFRQLIFLSLHQLMAKLMIGKGREKKSSQASMKIPRCAYICRYHICFFSLSVSLLGTRQLLSFSCAAPQIFYSQTFLLASHLLLLLL